MSKKSIFTLVFAFAMIFANAQIGKSFTKQFDAIAKAPLSDVLGSLKPNDSYSMYDEIYQCKMPLEGFEVSVGKKETYKPLFAETITETIVYAKYKGKSEDFDQIMEALKTLPYHFEAETGNNLYKNYFTILSKSTGSVVAKLTLSAFNNIEIEFISKN